LARFVGALALVRAVEGDEAGLGQLARVRARGLLLNPVTGVRNDDGGVMPGRVEALGIVDHRRQRNAMAVAVLDADPFGCHWGIF